MIITLPEFHEKQKQFLLARAKHIGFGGARGGGKSFVVRHKKGRQTKINEIAKNHYTTILYESPFRLVKTLQQLAEVCGNERRVSVARELTKIYEENVRGTLEEVINHFSQKEVKGEIVIVLDGIEKE